MLNFAEIFFHSRLLSRIDRSLVGSSAPGGTLRLSQNLLPRGPPRRPTSPISLVKNTRRSSWYLRGWQGKWNFPGAEGQTEKPGSTELSGKNEARDNIPSLPALLYFKGVQPCFDGWNSAKSFRGSRSAIKGGEQGRQ